MDEPKYLGKVGGVGVWIAPPTEMSEEAKAVDSEAADKIGSYVIDIVEDYLQETITRNTAQKRIGDQIADALADARADAERRAEAMEKAAREYIELTQPTYGIDEEGVQHGPGPIFPSQEYFAAQKRLAALLTPKDE